jgi:hypothetical protein
MLVAAWDYPMRVPGEIRREEHALPRSDSHVRPDEAQSQLFSGGAAATASRASAGSDFDPVFFIIEAR